MVPGLPAVDRKSLTRQVDYLFSIRERELLEFDS